MNQQSSTDQAVIAHLAWVFGNGWTAAEAGPTMACMEADALAAAIAAGGHIDEAGVWLRGHAAADNEEDDTHWGLSTAALRDYALLLVGEGSIVEVLRQALHDALPAEEHALRETFPVTTTTLDRLAAGTVDPAALVVLLARPDRPVRSWSAAEDELTAVQS